MSWWSVCLYCSNFFGFASWETGRVYEARGWAIIEALWLALIWLKRYLRIARLKIGDDQLMSRNRMDYLVTWSEVEVNVVWLVGDDTKRARSLSSSAVLGSKVPASCLCLTSGSATKVLIVAKAIWPWNRGTLSLDNRLLLLAITTSLATF